MSKRYAFEKAPPSRIVPWENACAGCGAPFPNPKEWAGHLRIDKTTDEPVGVCDQCEKDHARFWSL